MSDNPFASWYTKLTEDEYTFDIPIVGETKVSTMIYAGCLLKAIVIIVALSCKRANRNRRLTLNAKWA
ncbi:TPA_asm: P6 [Mentha alphacytorhabdovirus 1]|nr:TPA_asm: P6 [Mentha alphacytorhabdovirus 1]